MGKVEEKVMQDDIGGNINLIYQRIKSVCERVGRDPKGIRVIAISKTFSPEHIEVAYKFGIKDFGENYVQEALFKMEKLKHLDITWHFVGRIQSNKIKSIIGNFGFVHSLCSLDHVIEFEKRLGGKLKAFLQINIAEEKTKGGIFEKDILNFIERFYEISPKSLELIGLMTIPPPDISRFYFKRLREIRDELIRRGYPITELSMGMSDDFEIAIEEGATFIRIGRAIFGERQYKLG